MAMMRNVGMDQKPVAADMPMPMRKDIDKFRSAVDAKYDDPKSVKTMYPQRHGSPKQEQ